jgi:hypothetical protein
VALNKGEIVQNEEFEIKEVATGKKNNDEADRMQGSEGSGKADEKAVKDENKVEPNQTILVMNRTTSTKIKQSSVAPTVVIPQKNTGKGALIIILKLNNFFCF